MKKLSIIILAALLVALCFALSACGHKHSFGEWETASAPSCTNSGYQQRVCDMSRTRVYRYIKVLK